MISEFICKGDVPHGLDCNKDLHYTVIVTQMMTIYLWCLSQLAMQCQDEENSES